jgi:hypothetical protein
MNKSAKLRLLCLVLALGAFTVGVCFTASQRRYMVVDLRGKRLATGTIIPGATWVPYMSDGKLESAQHCYVDLQIDDVRAFRGHVSLISVTCKRGAILSCDVNLDPGTVDEVYAQALDFSRRWGLRTIGLDQWRAKVRAVGVRSEDFATAGAGRNDTDPSTSIEIFDSFDKSRPVCVTLSFVWKNVLLPAPSSEPASLR